MHIFLGGLVSAVAASCGGKVIDDKDAGPPPACTSGDSSLGTLNLASPADYVDQRHEMLGSSNAPVVVDRSTGVRCATATNATPCNAALDAARSSMGFQRCLSGGPISQCMNEYLAYTVGDTVGMVTTLDDLKAFLGPIDTPDEAVLIVSLTQGGSYPFDCAETLVRQTADGYDVIAKTSGCTGSAEAQFHVTTAGDVTKIAEQLNSSGNNQCPVARRTAGLADVRVSSKHPVGAFFARAAYYEAMSVDAFHKLDKELRAHGAPSRLRRAARAAARDEAVHANLTALVARRYGAASPSRSSLTWAVRSLEEVALENVVEGCVRETHGALVATWQARAARDPFIQKIMASISRDEARHATLARRVAAWAMPRLPARARARIERARRDAIASVRAEAATPKNAELVALAGMPDARTGVALVDALHDTLSNKI